MKEELSAQIAELQLEHKGLIKITDTKNETVLSGPLPFKASTDGFSPITDCFEIELIIPDEYTEMLPRVRETGGKIDKDYDHLNPDGTLCLAVPIEGRRLFREQPTLLGFVNKLVIPYFFDYCHWKENGEHPFDEQAHGNEGIVQHYIDSLRLQDEISALAVLSYLLEYGYRGHHPCPCGSSEKVRNCHGKALHDLHELHTELTLKYDFLSVREVCIKKVKEGKLQIPDALYRQDRRIIKKIKN